MKSSGKNVRLAITTRNSEDGLRIAHITKALGFSPPNFFNSPRETFNVASRQQYKIFITYQGFTDMSGLTMIQSLRATGNYGLESHLVLSDQIDREIMVVLAEHNIRYVVTKPFSSDHIRQKLESLWNDEINISAAENSFREAHAASQSGLFDMALELMSHLLSQPTPAEKHFILVGDIFLKLKNYDKARVHYQKARDAYPGSYVPVHKLAALLIKEKRYAEAAPMFDELAKISPLNLEILANTGLAHFELRQYNEARAAMLKLKALDRERKDANELLAKIAIRIGDYTNGLRLLAELHEASECFEVLHHEAGHLRQQNAFLRVVDFYLKCIESVGDHPLLFDLYYRLGTAYQDIYDEISAKRYFQRSLKLSPDFEPSATALEKLLKTRT